MRTTVISPLSVSHVGLLTAEIEALRAEMQAVWDAGGS